MKEHEDLLMRQIEQLTRALGAFLAKIIGLKNSGSASFEVKAVEEDLSGLLDMDLDTLVTFTDDDFINHLTKRLKDEKNLEQFADILYELAPYKQNRDIYYTKLLLILNHIMTQTKTYSLELVQKINIIQQLIK